MLNDSSTFVYGAKYRWRRIAAGIKAAIRVSIGHISVYQVISGDSHTCQMAHDFFKKDNIESGRSVEPVELKKTPPFQNQLPRPHFQKTTETTHVHTLSSIGSLTSTDVHDVLWPGKSHIRSVDYR